MIWSGGVCGVFVGLVVLATLDVPIGVLVFLGFCVRGLLLCGLCFVWGGWVIGVVVVRWLCGFLGGFARSGFGRGVRRGVRLWSGSTSGVVVGFGVGGCRCS